MSRVRIVGGTITKTTVGAHHMYSEESIVFNSSKTINEVGEENGVIYAKPKDAPPVPLLKKYFVDGWWSLDKEGEKKIKRALPGMTVFFHLKTKNIPNEKSVFLSLYDEDNHEKEESQNKDGKKDKDDFIKLFNTKSKKQVLIGKVIDNKVTQEITLIGLSSFINDEHDKCLELYFRCSYENENAEFPGSSKDYLKLGQIVIDRYKMPGLNKEGSNIADDMTYGYGHKHEGDIYSSELVKNYKKEYKTSGFNIKKHGIFSNIQNLPNIPFIKNEIEISSPDNQNYQAVQDNVRVVKPDPIKILNSNISTINKNNKAKYTEAEILELGNLMEFSNTTDFRLWFNFRTLKALLAWGSLSSVLEEMIDKFQRSEGGIYENPILTKSIKENENTKIYCTKVEDYIAEQLKINISKLEEAEDLDPYFEYMEGKSTKLSNNKGEREKKAKKFSRPAYSYWDSNNFAGNLFTGRTLSLNDIWATEVIIKELKLEGDNYTGKYEVTLWDHFGLDKPDLEKFYYNFNGFRAWFLLQHIKGFKPFLSKITFIKDFKGNLKIGRTEIDAERQKVKQAAEKQDREKAERMRIIMSGPKF